MGKKPGGMLRRNVPAKKDKEKRRRPGQHAEKRIIFAEIFGNESTVAEEEHLKAIQTRQSLLLGRLSKAVETVGEDKVTSSGRARRIQKPIPNAMAIIGEGSEDDDEIENHAEAVKKVTIAPEAKAKKPPKGRRKTSPLKVSKDKIEDNSEMRRFRNEMEALEDYELAISNGPGNQNWLPLNRQDSTSVSKSAILVDKTNDKGSPDSLNTVNPAQIKKKIAHLLLPPSLAETATSTPIAKKKPLDRDRVFPELVAPPPTDLNMSAIEAEPNDENVLHQPLTASPPLNLSFVKRRDSNESMPISSPVVKVPEVLSVKAAFRRLSMCTIGTRLNKKDAALALSRLDEDASEASFHRMQQSANASVNERQVKQTHEHNGHLGDVSVVSPRKALSSEEDFFDDKLPTPPLDGRKSPPKSGPSKQALRLEESAGASLIDSSLLSSPPLRNNRSRISASSSGVDVPEHKGDQADTSDVLNVSVFKQESDSHADQNSDDSSVVADDETESLRHEDSDADDDSSEDENLSLAQSLISQSSDLSVNATKRNFSRLSVADGASPFYMKGRRHERSPMEDILHVCGQERLLAWEEAFPGRMLTKSNKIGEGVYGEVFRAINADGISVALKVIPIEGSELVNDEKQKTFEEILPEILIAKELSEMRCSESDYSTPNFVQVIGARVVCGAYPQSLISAWNSYAEKKRSENDCPDMFKDTQLFVVFEFGDGGDDLENFKFKSVSEAKSVFMQVVLTLAIAEESINFEHRDLHIGNILVSRTSEATINYRFAGKRVVMQSMGVHVYIIDFTNSRLTKDGCTIFTDLSADEAMFEGPADEYQFDIYRMMRQANNNDWRSYCPKSNVLWLHYLIDKLIKVKRYRSRKMTEAQVVDFLSVYNELLNFDNCTSLMGTSTVLFPWVEMFGITCVD